jgi:hypothetical protein
MFNIPKEDQENIWNVEHSKNENIQKYIPNVLSQLEIQIKHSKTHFRMFKLNILKLSG